jgi:type I restriction enzyme S subunit
MEMPIPYPSMEEQVKIGAYFSTLDHLITLHQRKSDGLKELKRFMLQNMFPSNDTMA